MSDLVSMDSQDLSVINTPMVEFTPPNSASYTPMSMIAQAVANGAPIDVVERLLQLQERFEENEARKAFVSAMAEFKAAPMEIKKNKHVGFESRDKSSKTDYYHATLDTIVAAVSPELAKVGLSYRWKTEQLDGGMIQVTCIVRHSKGYSEATSLRAGADQSGNKNNVQAVGSTCSYLERYTLMAALGLASADMDDDGKLSSGEDAFISQEQVDQIKAGLLETKGDVGAFCKFLKVGSLEEIPANGFKKAMACIDAKRKKVDHG